MASSSSLALLTTKYDVFVSFRGEDTRNNFTCFLFQALQRKGIDAFKDDADIKKGESIAPELLQAIQGSRIYVVVFSKNYASSTWCLRELVQISNCVQTSSKQVLPIFYDVDPSEVRKQSGNYGTEFANYEQRFREDKEKMEEVQRWREALTKVANVSGWDIENKPHYVIIDEVVQKIKEKLGTKYSSLPKDNLVGMDSRVEELTKHLHSGSDNDVRVIGISGMSGIGKTALARALCERISHRYDSFCFIDNVSEVFQKSGALGMQKQLLYQSLNEKNIEIYNVGMGTLLTSTRLCNAKRLIVFDIVEQDEQLNMFSGDRETLLRESLDGGSRIIIISRDGHILRRNTVDDVYEVKPLNVGDAIQLFCIKAFKCNYIISGYEELTHAILSFVQGHPLAIEVVGSSLFGKNVSQWRCTLDKLRNNTSENIMHKLRICFDELDATNKEIFLDMACFFSSYYEQDVKEILDFRGFYPDLGLSVLFDRSLITISEDGWIHMPNFLRDLGKFIIKEKSPKEARKWSRLWDYQDLHRVMLDKMDKTNIEAIVVDYISEEFRETTMIVDALSKMRNLKLLMLPDDIKYSGNINDLSNELGYLRWPHYPCRNLPQSFQPDKLVELSLRSSNIKQLWDETKPLHNLKRLDLSNSEKLIEIQNFGEAINLKSLSLEGCTRLKQIDPLIGFPKNLTILNLKDCKSLINLPHFREAINLKILNLEGCIKLRQIDPSIGFLKKLTDLNLKSCISLVSLPNNILELKSLEYLDLFGCSLLYKDQLLEEPRDVKHSKKLCIREAPSHSQSMLITVKMCFMWLLQLYPRDQKDSVSFLFRSLPIFSCMHQLDLSFCNLLQVPDAIGTLHCLKRLSLRGNNFAVMPSLKELSKLSHLNLQHCMRLENLPELPSQTDGWPYIVNWSQGDEYVSGLNTFNCPELAKRECCSNTCFPWIMQIIKAHHKYREMLWPPTISSIILGSEIPRWFNNQRHVCEDNIIRIDISPFMDDKDWIGVACCAIFVARNQRRMSPPKTGGRHFSYQIPLLFRADIVTDESDHMWLFYLSRGAMTKFRIAHNHGYDVEVRKYGYRLLYEKDIQLSNPYPTMIQSQTSLARKRKFSEIWRKQVATTFRHM